MKINTQVLPERIISWLNARGINNETIKHAALGWDGTHVIIPVLKEGHVLFNKKRRDPEVQTGPKYLYDAGGTMQLYNANELENSFNNQVFITEGEMDTLCLMSHGIFAVSSTGGASSFDPSWEKYFRGKKVFICYDNDTAGLNGALKVLKIIPFALVVLLPQAQGKDVTDFITKQGVAKFIQLASQSKNYKVPIDLDSRMPDGTERKRLEKEFSNCADEYLEASHTAPDNDRPFLELLASYCGDKTRYYKSLARRKNTSELMRSALDQARAVPATQFIRLQSDNFARCPFHTEKTPSLKYYADRNNFFCFGSCQRAYDAIDIVMRSNECSFIEAIKFINQI